MNTWTNKDMHEEAKKPKKMGHRPRSGNPSPSKLQTELDKFTSGKAFTSQNSRQNPGFMQPHQRNIKKNMMGSHPKSNLQNDMYRIYGVNKSDLGHTSATTPKTSSGKREYSNPKNPYAARITNQMMPNRVGQHTSHGNRSVSPNRFPNPDQNVGKDAFAAPKKPNMVDILKFQARTNLKNLEKDMSAVIGRHKKMVKKKKINKTGLNLYGFRKPSPNHKRVKSNMISKTDSWYTSNVNRNNQVDGVKGFGYGPLTSFNRGKESKIEPIKPFARNQSRKKYRDNSSDSYVSDSYLKSFENKRIKKKRKVKKVLPSSGIMNTFLGQPSPAMKK